MLNCRLSHVGHLWVFVFSPLMVSGVKGNLLWNSLRYWLVLSWYDYLAKLNMRPAAPWSTDTTRPLGALPAGAPRATLLTGGLQHEKKKFSLLNQSMTKDSTYWPTLKQMKKYFWDWKSHIYYMKVSSYTNENTALSRVMTFNVYDRHQP